MSVDTLLAPSHVIGSGSEIPTLTRCLLFSLNDRTDARFGHFRPIPGMDRSIRLFGEHPFDESVAFPRPLDPEELARWLMKLSYARQTEDRARYFGGEDRSGTKGWTISKSVEFVDEHGHPLVAAYATWIES